LGSIIEPSPVPVEISRHRVEVILDPMAEC
jgi:hypothetical protein